MLPRVNINNNAILNRCVSHVMKKTLLHSSFRLIFLKQLIDHRYGMQKICFVVDTDPFTPEG